MKAEGVNPFLLVLHTAIVTKRRKVDRHLWAPTLDRQLWVTAITQDPKCSKVPPSSVGMCDSVCPAQETGTKYLLSSGCFASFFYSWRGKKEKKMWDLRYRMYIMALQVWATSSVMKTDQKPSSTVTETDTKKREKGPALPETWSEIVPKISGWQISKGTR